MNAAEILSQQQINLDTGKYLKLLPHLHQTDGFFAAVFEKIVVGDAPAVVTVSAIDETLVVENEIKPKTKKVAKPKKESAIEEPLIEATAIATKVVKSKVAKVVKEKVAKEKTVKEDVIKVVKEDVVKEKSVKPKVTKSKPMKE